MKKTDINELSPKKRNAEIIDKFLMYLRTGRNNKLDEKTIQKYQAAVWSYWEFIKYKPLKNNFNQELATNFKKSLKNSSRTNYNTCSCIAEFYKWTCKFHPESNQNIYEGILALSPTKKEKNALNRPNIQDYPSVEEFDRLIDFPENNELDLRDKALLCFFYLSAGRIGAVCTAPLSSFNTETLDFYQDPDIMKTKRGKYIDCTLFRFGDKYVDIILRWINYLKNEKKFSDDKPIFPKQELIPHTSNQYYLSDKFYKSPNSLTNIISKRYKDKNIPYYSVHKFRHLACDTAIELARTAKELKAISQNVGHESVTTILRQYANMQPNEYKNIIKKLCRKSDLEQCKVAELTIEQLAQVIAQRSSNNF